MEQNFLTFTPQYEKKQTLEALKRVVNLNMVKHSWTSIGSREDHINMVFPFLFFFKIEIHSMQGRTATTRYEVARKRSTKRLKHTGNLFTKNLQLIGVC